MTEFSLETLKVGFKGAAHLVNLTLFLIYMETA